MTKRKSQPKKPKGGEIYNDEKWEAKRKRSKLLDQCHRMKGLVKYIVKDPHTLEEKIIYAAR